MPLEQPRPATLQLEATGSSLAEVLAEVQRLADGYFGDLPYRIVRCDARPLVRTVGGEVLEYEADAFCALAPVPRHAPGYFETEPDDTEEVPIP